MFNGIRNMGDAIECVRNARDCQMFQSAVASLREYMKGLGMGTQELLGLERIAYYPQNEYSDKKTKENMEAAKYSQEKL